MVFTKKLISLNQASKISGYHQDYLSSLIRKNEINGTKIGSNWFTTEEEINNYIFKKKIRHNELAVAGFFSIGRTKKIFVISIFILIIVVGSLLYFYNKKNNRNAVEEVKTELSNEAEIIN